MVVGDILPRHVLHRSGGNAVQTHLSEGLFCAALPMAIRLVVEVLKAAPLEFEYLQDNSLRSRNEVVAVVTSVTALMLPITLVTAAWVNFSALAFSSLLSVSAILPYISFLIWPLLLLLIQAVQSFQAWFAVSF